MLKIRVAIQCEDARTKQTGTFGFRRAVKTLNGPRFYSDTPVFKNLQGLIEYCNKNEIERDYTPTNYEDVL